MSVLIKGMKMPINCIECKIAEYDDDYGVICPFSGVACLSIGRQHDCPLVELQPHGRLIDADVMKTKIDGNDPIVPTLIEWIDAQSTVIEEDKSEIIKEE